MTASNTAVITALEENEKLLKLGRKGMKETGSLLIYMH